MVFTGLVQAVGRAVFDTTTNKLWVRATSDFWHLCATGDSIAVNGCCLTLLASTTTDTATFFVMEESRGKTNMVNLATTENESKIDQFLSREDFSTPVNLEKALKVGDPLGGHTVAGHVDGVAPIVEVSPHDDGSRSVWIDLKKFDPKHALVVHKGSIALDGVSLTIAELKGSLLRVSLIPHTLENTRLQYAKVGDLVNVEFDQTLKFYMDNSRKQTEKMREHVVEFLPENERRAKDEELMQRAIELGEYGRATAAPNPWVGCVITDPYGNIFGEGFHKKAGQAHAEVNAIQNAIAFGYGQRLEGATCYTTLEPCSHHGRTGPCAEVLIQYKFARVVVSLIDPDKHVSGSGIKLLQDAGISVTTGVLEKEARQSLRSYLYHRETEKPWVVFKLASSLDGKIAAPDGTSQWITSEEARIDCHQRFRAPSQAIIIGSKTAFEDNPKLTVRALPPGSDASYLTQPLRVVVGSKVTLKDHLLDTTKAPTLVFTSKEAEIPKEWEEKGVQVEKVDLVDGHVDFEQVLKILGKRNVLQILVEGGATFGSSILKQGHVNQLVVYQAPIILGVDSWAWSQVKTCNSITDQKTNWKLSKVSTLGEDVCLEYINQ